MNLTGSADLIATMLVTGTIGLVDTSGSFSIASVPAGSYVLTARVRHDDRDLEQALLPITVGEDDVTGLAIAMRRSVKIQAKPIAVSGNAIVDFSLSK